MALVECFSPFNWRSQRELETILETTSFSYTTFISFRCNLNQQWVCFVAFWICGLCKWTLHVKVIRMAEIRKFHFKNFLCLNVLSHKYVHIKGMSLHVSCIRIINSSSRYASNMSTQNILQNVELQCFCYYYQPFYEMCFRSKWQSFQRTKIRAMNLLSGLSTLAI